MGGAIDQVKVGSGRDKKAKVEEGPRDHGVGGIELVDAKLAEEHKLKFLNLLLAWERHHVYDTF